MMGFSLIHVYFGFLAFGLGYAVIVFMMGNLTGDHDGSGVDDVGDGDLDFHADGDSHMPMDFHAEHDGVVSDADHGSGHHGGLSPFSPLMLATFGTLFGGLGFISLGVINLIPVIPQSIADILSLFVSLALAIVLSSYFSYFLVKIFVSSETSSNVRSAKLIGREGETTMSFAAGKLGEISYQFGGSCQTGMARLADGIERVERGQRVRIEGLNDNVLLVRPVEKLAHEELELTS